MPRLIAQRYGLKNLIDGLQSGLKQYVQFCFHAKQEVVLDDSIGAAAYAFGKPICQISKNSAFLGFF
jgi:hypothetical protein